METLDIIKPEILINEAKEKGRNFAKEGIKTNQIRNFFSAIVSIKNDMLSMNEFNFSMIETKLILLKPKLAYAAGRQKKVESFKTFMDDAIDAVLKANDKEKALKNFFNLIESIIAYHKYYGGD
ncbi:MAG: type III-A CRISPR-associated protein Csm2 [Bacteroidetes bacterium CG23_combo_of_CG06-09_8_20_14_all_32_9]|nr:MAG: type III-A CRISPR-associated protein Csm2 [Bacteroidetes bacterium CG23_combo_of_CG06-09_8_20_14_all_32_9]